jgi:hypothetical protein
MKFGPANGAEFHFRQAQGETIAEKIGSAQNGAAWQ